MDDVDQRPHLSTERSWRPPSCVGAFRQVPARPWIVAGVPQTDFAGHSASGGEIGFTIVSLSASMGRPTVMPQLGLVRPRGQTSGPLGGQADDAANSAAPVTPNRGARRLASKLIFVNAGSQVTSRPIQRGSATA